MGMSGQTVTHFEILEQIGSGGMGDVYLAEDLRLGRKVALKFLPRHLDTDERAKRRFMTEARAASSLNHPGICTIFDIGETDDGQTFIAMAHYHGETLKERLEKGPVETDLALDMARQVGEALAAAHEKGIVHRDIKPANVFLTERGRAVLLDFGIAKLAGSADQTQTRPGVMMGTPKYMSPEQVRGESVDQTTDIWSLGVVLYEALAGRHPFQSEYPQASIYSILNEQPDPIRQYRAEAPESIIDVVRRCLQKEQAKRFQDVESLLQALTGASSTDARKEEPEQSAAQASIAVLPFANLSNDPEQDYFCDGMAEEISSALMQVEGLRVAARSSSFAFKGKHEDVRRIGEELGVNMVLDGSVRLVGERLRITAQLVDATRGFHVWSDRYDRKLEDVFEIQDAIARSIVSELSVHLGRGSEQQLVMRPTDNLEAYDAYLQGRYYFDKRSESDNLKAIESFEKATELDPNFGLGFASLAAAYVEHMFTHEASPDWERKAFVALEKARSLDPTIPQIYVARGNLIWTHTHHFPHNKAVAEYQEAIRLDPNLADGYNELARVYWHIGQLDAAFDALRKAMEIDPAFIDGQFRLGWLEMHRGNYKNALTLLSQVPEGSLAPAVDSLLALTLLYLDRPADGWARLKRVPERFEDQCDYASTVAIFMAIDGETESAEKRIAASIETGKDLGHFHHVAGNIADAYAVMGKVDLAIDWLETTAREGFPCYPWFERNPCLQNLRGVSRFEDFMERLKQEWDDYQALTVDELY